MECLCAWPFYPVCSQTKLERRGNKRKGQDKTGQDRTGQDSGEVVRVGEKWFLCNNVQLSVCCLLPTSSHEVL